MTKQAIMTELKANIKAARKERDEAVYWLDIAKGDLEEAFAAGSYGAIGELQGRVAACEAQVRDLCQYLMAANYELRKVRFTPKHYFA